MLSARVRRVGTVGVKTSLRSPAADAFEAIGVPTPAPAAAVRARSLHRDYGADETAVHALSDVSVDIAAEIVAAMQELSER
jgi:hypothetical protein